MILDALRQYKVVTVDFLRRLELPVDAAISLLDSTGVLAESIRRARVSWESLGARLASGQ